MNETEDVVARAVARGITRWVINAALIAFTGYWLVNGGLFIMGLCEADSDFRKGMPFVTALLKDKFDVMVSGTDTRSYKACEYYRKGYRYYIHNYGLMKVRERFMGK